MNQLFSTLLLFAALALPLFAEKSPGDPKEIHIRPLAVSLSGNLETLRLHDNERDLGAITLETTSLGPRHAVPLRQFSYGIDQPDGSYRSLGMISLPEVGSDFILVFAPADDSYQVFPIRADDPEFRGNDSIIFNFTPYVIKISLGESSKQITTMSHELMKPVFSKNDTTYNAKFFYEKSDQSIPFSHSRWPVNPNLKTLVFIFIDPETKLPAYRGVPTSASE